MSAKSGSFVLQDLQSRLENVQDLNVEDIRRLVNGLSRISAKNQRSVSFMRLVLSRLTSMINLQTNLVSILSDIRLMLLVTAFAGPSTSYSVLSRVSKSLNRDIKQYMAYQIPYYIATLRPPTIDSVNRHGVVTLIDLKNSQLREEIEHYNMEQSKFELDYMLEYSDGEEMKHSFKSEIEHGILLESGERILSKYSAELDENIDVFMAVNDVQRRELYPLSHLASQLNFSAESIAIFIARNEELRDEIYQATGYQHIPDTPVTRKSGECFISFKAWKYVLDNQGALVEIPLGTLSGKKRKAEEGSNGIMSRAKYSSTPSPSRSPDRQTSVNIVGPSPHIRYDVVSYGSSQPQIYQADGQVWAQGAVPTLLTAPSSGYAQPFSYIVHPQGASTGATYSLYGPASGNLFGNHGTYVYQPQQVQHPHLTHLYPQSGYGVPNLSSSGSSSVQAQSALYGSSNGVQPSSQDHDEADMELSMSLYAQGNGTASAVASRSIDENSSVIFGSGSGLDSNGATVPPTVTSSVDASAYNYAYPSAYSTLDSNSSQPMSVYPAEVSRQAPPPDSSAANSNMYPPDPYTGTSPLEPQTSDLQSTQT